MGHAPAWWPMTIDVSLRAVALVAGGSALGGTLRFLTQVWLTRHDFPWGTVAVNLAGSFFIGFLMFGAVARGYLGADTRLFLAVGLLGGFTTMSSFAYETLALAEDSEALRAIAYATLTVLGSLGMAYMGRALATMPAGGA